MIWLYNFYKLKIKQYQMKVHQECSPYCDVIEEECILNTKWVYFTLLQVQFIISWINVCHSTNHSSDYIGINDLFYTFYALKSTNSPLHFHLQMIYGHEY
jgi:hypothetical protein